MGYFANLHQAHTGLHVPQPRDPENDTLKTTLPNGTALVAGLANQGV